MLPIIALRRMAIVTSLCLLACTASALPAQAPDLHRGYYSDPALHGDTIIFTSEGDLWSVSIHGGEARRLTSGSGTERKASISPDGKTVAFRANYEGPSEVYTIPIGGGLPQRRTWDANSEPEGWAPDGRLLVATERYSTLPSVQLVLIDAHSAREIVPLAQAAEGAYSTDGHTLFSPAGSTSGVRPSATKAAGLKTCGASTERTKPFRLPRTIRAPRPIQCSGTAASISSPTAMES